MSGSYGLRETAAPAGYLVDGKTHRFTVDAHGTIERLPSLTVEVDDDYTKIDLSKRDITNEDEIPGAHMALLDHEGPFSQHGCPEKKTSASTRLHPATIPW